MASLPLDFAFHPRQVPHRQRLSPDYQVVQLIQQNQPSGLAADQVGKPVDHSDSRDNIVVTVSTDNLADRFLYRR